MNTDSRTKNAKLNIAFSFTNKIVLLILTFIVRKLFINFIGVEYLGINGLFANILTLLSIADLGIATAINVHLYKPIANGDTKKISAIINYFKVVYRVIAITVFVIGMCLLPFLQYIVNLDNDIPHIYLYYCIFVIKNVVSYLLVYKACLINADQRNYKINIIEIFTQITIIIAQIVCIVILKNYLIYLLLSVVQILLHNIIVSFVADKYYPFLKNKEILSKEDKSTIFAEIKSAFLYKISMSIINGTDNILISVLIGTVTVGLYSNYLTITSNIDAFIILLFSSLISSVGNLIAKETREKSYEAFRMIQVACFGISTFCTVSLLFLTQDFIALFFGQGLLLDNLTLIAILANFYITTSMRCLNSFREGVGMYKQIKWATFIAAIINISLSILLCKLIGLSGIFFATSISKLLTFYWYEPLVLYRKHFQMSVKKYFIDNILNFLLLLFCIALCSIPIHFITTVNYLTWFLKAIICLFITGTIYLLFYFRNSSFLLLLQRMKIVKGNKRE